MSDGPPNLDDDLRELVDLDRKKKRLKKEAEAAGAAYQRKEREVYAKFESAYGANIKTINVDLGEGYGSMKFGRRKQIFAKIEDEDTARASLEKLGLADAMFQSKPFKRALNDFVKEILEGGGEFPEGIDFTEKLIVSKQSA